MKILAIILILSGAGGILDGDFISGLILLYIGTYLWKRNKKGKSKQNNKSVEIKTLKEYQPNGSEFIALDIETTGLSPEYDSILEIAAIKFSNGEEVEIFHTLIDPQSKIPPEVSKINNITDDMVKGKPTINDVLPKFLQFIENYPVIGHNVIFDINFIKNACKRYFNLEKYWIENRLVDTVRLSRKMFPELRNHKLDTVIEHLNIKIDDRHRALDDAYASAQIYLYYLEYIKREKENKLKNLTVQELEAFNIIKDMLIKNKRDIKYLSFRKTGKYFDVVTFFDFARIKLNGKKHYLISNLEIPDLQKYQDKFNLEECPKSETGKTRIIINDVKDILDLEDLIIDSFDKTMETLEYYKENDEKVKKYIQEYLETI